MTGVVRAIEAVSPRSIGDETAFDGAQFELARRFGIAQANGDGAAVQLQRHVLVVDAQHFEFSAGVEPDSGGADAHFSM